MDRKKIWKEYHELGPVAFWQKCADEAESDEVKETFLRLAMLHEEPEPGEALLELEQASEVTDFIARGPTRRERFSWWLASAKVAVAARIEGLRSIIGDVFSLVLALIQNHPYVTIGVLATLTLWGVRSSAIWFFVVVVLWIITAVYLYIKSEEGDMPRWQWIVRRRIRVVIGAWLAAALFVSLFFRPVGVLYPEFFCVAELGETTVSCVENGSWIRPVNPISHRVIRVHAPAPFAHSVKAYDEIVLTTEGDSRVRRVVTRGLEFWVGLKAKTVALADLSGGDPQAEFDRFTEEVVRAFVDAAATTYAGEIPAVIESASEQAILSVQSPLFQIRAYDVGFCDNYRCLPEVRHEVLIDGDWHEVDMSSSSS